MTVGIRVVGVDDAEALAEVLGRNRTFLAPWDPVRDDAYFTAAGQRSLIGQSLRRYEQGLDWPAVITVDGAPVGRVNLNNIVRGAFRSADLGYWVDAVHNGRGVATAAVAAIVATLALAWGVGEVTGYQRSLNLRPPQARAFYGLYAAAVIGCAVLVGIWPDLVSLNVGVQVMNALLLPLVLGFLVALSIRALPPAVRLRGWYKGVVIVVIGLTTLLGVFGGFSGAGLL